MQPSISRLARAVKQALVAGLIGLEMPAHGSLSDDRIARFNCCKDHPMLGQGIGYKLSLLHLLKVHPGPPIRYDRRGETVNDILQHTIGARHRYRIVELDVGAPDGNHVNARRTLLAFEGIERSGHALKRAVVPMYRRICGGMSIKQTPQRKDVIKRTGGVDTYEEGVTSVHARDVVAITLARYNETILSELINRLPDGRARCAKPRGQILLFCQPRAIRQGSIQYFPEQFSVYRRRSLPTHCALHLPNNPRHKEFRAARLAYR